jgi:hypothetical protein
MVPVLDKNKNPLMSCTERRARKLMEKGEAKAYWNRGIFCIILQRNPKTTYLQEIVIAIDPGSKFEGYTVKSEAHTVLNIQCEAKTDVKDKLEVRRNLRRNRRQRKTRYRKCRFNRTRRKGWIPPSTQARWDIKISIINWLRKLYPITYLAIEDIQAATWKGAKKWNKNFSPIEVGKSYFKKFCNNENLKLFEYKGYDTHAARQQYNLKKNKVKSKREFFTHCVDSYTIASFVVGGDFIPDNTRVLFLKPIKKFRRQLHVQNFAKRDIRKNYGSTRSLGLERNTLVKHSKYEYCLVGGTSNDKVSLNSVSDNKRLCQNAKVEDLKILTHFKWNVSWK